MFYDIIEGNHVADSYYQLSQLNIDLNEPNKAFLFGINYVILTDDTDFREELEKTFEVSYMSEDKIHSKHNFSQRNYYSNIYFLKEDYKMHVNIF